jgi:hypothetical protein
VSAKSRRGGSAARMRPPPGSTSDGHWTESERAARLWVGGERVEILSLAASNLTSVAAAISASQAAAARSAIPFSYARDTGAHD